MHGRILSCSEKPHYSTLPDHESVLGVGDGIVHENLWAMLTLGECALHALLIPSEVIEPLLALLT
jgi:hypothetical protein